VAVLVTVVGLWAFGAVAAETDRPWAKGVSNEAQEQALALFRDGNAALKESLFVAAAQKYREALKVWDHPAIHYNLALALVNLDQPVETHEHLLKALEYGPAPLDTDKYDQAVRYKALVEGQLAQVDITCQEPGADVLMDGRSLFTAPGHYDGWVRSGPHTVVATKEGFLPSQQSKTLPAGEVSKFDLKLFTTEDLTEYRRRWATWMPWTVVGAGAAVTLGGVVMHLSARDTFSRYDKSILDCTSAVTGGCQPPVALTAQKSQGDVMQGLAITSYAIGGAALATGAVLVYMNRLQPVSGVKKDVEVTVVPTLSPDGAGAAALIRF